MASEVVENLTLHALNFCPVAASKGGEFLRPGRHPELRQQAQKIGDALLRHREFVIVTDHVSLNSGGGIPSSFALSHRALFLAVPQVMILQRHEVRRELDNPSQVAVSSLARRAKSSGQARYQSSSSFLTRGKTNAARTGAGIG